MMDHWINGVKSGFVPRGTYAYNNGMSDPL